MSDDPIPRFDVIKNSDFEPAIKQGIAEEDEDIRNITSCISRPTFANTIEKLDSAGELLERVTDVFYNLLNAASDEEKEQLAEKFTPILAAHQNNIMLNQDLFLRVKYVYTHPLKSLSPEKLRLTEKIYRSFRRSGAMLKGEDRKQFRKLTEEASKLTLQFQTNLLHARKKFSLNIIGKDMLDGVPETVLDTAAATARENGENGWTITLDEPVYMPVLTYCNNRELRRALYMAYHGVCLRKGEDCNTEICKDIVNVRQKWHSCSATSRLPTMCSKNAWQAARTTYIACSATSWNIIPTRQGKKCRKLRDMPKAWKAKISHCSHGTLHTIRTS